MLDLDVGLLRTFTLVAKLNSFTAAGEMLGASQSAVSLRVAKLEELLRTKLLARTPRSVALTPEGLRFLSFAQATVASHDAALRSLREDPEPAAIRFAVSDHAVGSRLIPALSSLKLSLPEVAPEMMVGSSSEMRALFDAGGADIAVVRQDGDRQKAQLLFEDPLVWAGSAALDWSPGRPVPLVALRGICSVKAAAIRALDEARLPWRQAFAGGSVSALKAAVEAGLGIGAFGQRQVAPALRVAPEAGLPGLPAGAVVLFSRLPRPVTSLIAAAFKSTGA